MRFKTLAIFGVIVGSVIFPQVSFGAVLYDNSTIGVSISLPAGSSTAPITYDVLGSGVGMYSPSTGGGGTLFTTSTTTTILRIKIISGDSCSNIVAEQWMILLSPWVSPYLYKTIGTATSSGLFCDLPISIPAGVGIGAISKGTTHSFVLDGNDSIGRSYDGDNNYRSIGGFAFQLCDSGGCSGGFAPPLIDTTTRFDFTIPSATSTPTVATSTSVGAQVK